jgi:hypothetical protein
MLAEDRRRQPQHVIRERPVPQIPQLLQSLRGIPGPAAAMAEPVTGGSAEAGLPIMVQPQLRPPAQETGRLNVVRPARPPNITSFMFGTAGTPSSRPSTPPIPTETQWDNPAQLIARSMALRQTSATAVTPTPSAEGAPSQQTAVVPDDDRPPRDPVLVPNDGHFPMYEANMDPTRPNFPD